MDLGPAQTADKPLGQPLPESAWLEPIPNGRIAPPNGDPGETAVLHETIRLAFIAALQYLPPKQRAVLILRDVLRWRANEVAELLDTTVQSVNSALQRAHSTLRDRDPAESEPVDPMDDRQRALLARYVDAFERYDMDSLTSLLREDATWSMPPYELWLHGRKDIFGWWFGPGAGCAGSKVIPTISANGRPAFGQYKPSETGEGYEPWALQVLEIEDGKIVEFTFFLDTERVFPLFGLPLGLES
jgi:RNA polymerase sigma-70 factor (ECF subfamily)